MNKPFKIQSPNPDEVRLQMRRILASEMFARCRRMQRFLEFVVEETLAGRADGLGEYAIGSAVFDRNEGFEPALDPIVRNDARRLRQKLSEYYRQHPGGVLIEMPKGGYVPVFRKAVSPATAGPAQVSYVVHGTVFESGGKYRVMIHLIGMPDGVQTCVREFDFDATQIPRVPERIAAGVMQDACGHARLQLVA